MTQYNSVSVKLSDSSLNKLKSATKSETGVTLRLTSNRISYSNDETSTRAERTNFPHELLLTNREIANLREAFATIYELI